jgi:hypothetical protein
VGTCLFAKPLLNNGSRIFAYFAVVAQQRVYMLQYGKFVVWPHGSDKLHNFFSHLNSFRPSNQFTVEIESNSAIPVLDVLDIRKGTL